MKDKIATVFLFIFIVIPVLIYYQLRRIKRWICGQLSYEEEQ